MNIQNLKHDVSASLAGDRFTTARLGHLMLKRLGPGRKSAYDEAYNAVRVLMARGFVVRVGRGLYQLTELGAAWCGAANVAKP